MSIEERPDGTLVFRNPNGFLEYVVEYSRKLMEENEFFGAFGRIHSLIGFMMQNRFEMDTRVMKGLLPEELEFEMREGKLKIYHWRELIKKLLEAELITENEAERIENFGHLRDRIMHRLMKYGFHAKDKYRVRREEAVKVFEEGIEIVNLLRASTSKFGDSDGYQWTTTHIISPKKQSPRTEDNK